jgi:hypothetical protein
MMHADLEALRQAVEHRRALDREMAELLWKLRCLSHGSTYGYNGSGGGPVEPDGWVDSLERRLDDIEPERLR